MENLKFDFVFLGQSVLKYQVPLDIFMTINHIYDVNKNSLDKANGQLVGKIEGIFKHHNAISNCSYYVIVFMDVPTRFLI